MDEEIHYYVYLVIANIVIANSIEFASIGLFTDQAVLLTVL
jgi:hypothetical protein